ncbi:phosphotransferase [Oceanobacillus profundus]|uniref:Spore coat protein YsxE n=2 Tax=Oceanobacillus profundus TaxID=372463 RepID=A0A417YIY2_9BACI|nr:phosphotransferase [Oceanobacillus profundus]MCM3396987.1 phosphotransferase [Oceanobacillus profundus]MDO6448288.1 phosphotransferase [Oceanobacillus profundus]RHW33026.1 spore coat protein YsxE [Oceanobacillus profundus]
MMEVVKDILQAYRIFPTEIEKVTDRLYHIKDSRRDYALKKSTLKQEDIAAWEHVYYVANEKNLSEIVPVYLTKDGKLYEDVDGFVYYLSPWLLFAPRSSSETSIERTMGLLAHIHDRTQQSQRISKSSLNKNFHTYQTFCEQLPNELYSYVLRFEQQAYMSPFELQVCTHYRDIETALNRINGEVSEFLDQSEEEITWNLSLCHGNLALDHVLNNHIINWEQARYDHVAVDLTNYFHQLTGEYDQPNELIMEGFKVYKRKYDLEMFDMKLLSIYLLNPADYMTIIRDYVKSTKEKPLTYQVSALQKQYRKLIFALKWTDFIKEEYETINFDDLSN